MCIYIYYKLYVKYKM